MEKIKFNRDRYTFSSKYKKSIKLDNGSMRKAINIFLKELRTYNIRVSRLYNIRPKDNEKNFILNIAYYIVEDEELLDKLMNKKELPYKILTKEIKVEIEFLEKWRHYIIAYVLLLYNKKYLAVSEYLNIEFKEVAKLKLVEVVNNLEKGFSKGVVVKSDKKYPVILTRQGEFIKIKYNEENNVGEEKAGKEKKNLRHHRKKVIAILLIVILSCIAFVYINNYTVRTVVIDSTSNFKLEGNMFDRVRYNYSQTEKGSNILAEIDVTNKKVDYVIVECLKCIREQGMVLDDKLVTIVVTGKKIDSEQLNTIKKFMDEQDQLEDQTKKIKVAINNVGSDSNFN